MRFLDQFVRVSPQLHCPVCDHTDWCCVHKDGTTAICQRVPSGVEYGDAGFIHNLKDRVPVQWVKPVVKKRWSQDQIADIVKATFNKANRGYRERVARQLGVSHDSLIRLGVGMGRKGFATFPMVDGDTRLCGIAYRFGSGRKSSLKGGSPGLFVPSGLPTCGLVYIVEGPTDTAAMLTMGLDAVGRPGTGGVDKLVRFAENFPCLQFCIVADNDKPDKMGRYAGYEAAMELSQAMPRVVQIIQPIQVKDARGYLTRWPDHAMAARAIMNADPNHWRILPLGASDVRHSIRPGTQQPLVFA